MNQRSAFFTAFWTGLASPAALFSATPVYIPAVMNFTIGSAFASVGASLNRFSVMAPDDKRAAESTAA
ncbi:hypothetical protein [Bradyrhizobium sp. CCBAU 51745]|uniref:hypothetical protein n=1 Tax=Bradyrhizobium sp. CCBAU 51745 TaxID=1325099 RepID=UPI0023067D4D|nr:hypothetical protein [Bradyrhizobium sp. CCBAU 51745]